MCDDEQVASATRTKRIRTAHRGAVTRLINQMDEALLATDVSRLKQLSQSLKNKIDTCTLLKLDEELLVSVEEEELDHEIEQADIVRERAELAIIRRLTKLARVRRRELLLVGGRLHARTLRERNTMATQAPLMQRMATNRTRPQA